MDDPIERSVRTIDVGPLVEALRPSLVDDLVGRLIEVATAHRLEAARQAAESDAKLILTTKALKLDAIATTLILAISDQPLEPF